MNVKAIMTRNVAVIGPDESLQAVRQHFHDRGFHHLLVLEDGELLGVISDRDVLKAISPFLDTLNEQWRDLDTLSRRAHQIMSRAPVTVRGDTPVAEAAELMLDQRISCLPVVSEQGAVEGIVTTRDILRYTVEQRRYHE